MKKISGILMLLLLSVISNPNVAFSQKKGWISLFDGKTFDGWKVGENASTFSITDNGEIKVAGPKAHLFYVGPVKNHVFKNFEFKAKVKTTKGSNSGIYFHAKYQESGWPQTGYEVQINTTHGDPIKSGSLYEVVNVRDVWVKDDEWYETYIKVVDKRIIIKINDITVVDYTEPEVKSRNEEHPHRFIDPGTFAIQGHDPKSVVYLKDIQVKPLKD
jgi:hypothetical protein